MTLAFYPNSDDSAQGSLYDRIERLMGAAEQYKAVVLDHSEAGKRSVMAIPRDQTSAFNWEEIARVLHALKVLPEISRHDKSVKADLFSRLAEVYEVLRAAKMPKLEAVRIAISTEAKQLYQQAGEKNV